MRTTIIRQLRVAAALLGCLATACLSTAGVAPEDLGLPEGRVRYLFVGNSLTYSNSLPAMVNAVARQAGDTLIATADVSFPNFALWDHWEEGTARRALAEKKYEFVVMQQGPSSLPENQRLLAEWSGRFDPLIRGAGAEPVLFMVWPSIDRFQDFPGVRQSYRNAAAVVKGIFAPAGDAWLASWEQDSTLALYADALHPTVMGTYLAALVVLSRTRGVDITALPPVIPGTTNAQIPAATVRLLQRGAQVALQRNPARP